MANVVYLSKTLLTGGTAPALDSIDGTGLVDGDFAHVTVSGVLYVYKLNATSGAAESSPTIISPDTNAGTKRWILQGVNAASLVNNSLTASLPLFSGASKEVVSKSVADTLIALGISDQTGWIPTGTFTYASAVTITVASGAASIYQKGDKIKLTQATGGVKYFYVVGVADTLLTITGGSSHTLVSQAITSPFYSHVENPLGFPITLSWVPTLTGGPADLSGYDEAWFSVAGNNVFFHFMANNRSLSGSAGSIQITLPITNVMNTMFLPATIYDGTNWAIAATQLTSSYAEFFKTAAVGNWIANETGVRLHLTGMYQF